MRIGFGTGYREEYWRGWPWIPMYGGSEKIVVEIASALAHLGHEVTVRLPRRLAGPCVDRGVRWVGEDHRPERYELLLCFDDFERRDHGDRVVLMACRSDPPRHRDFDHRIYLSRTHAELVDPGQPFLGGGVDLADYATPLPRISRRVICTSSPDRCPQAVRIGRAFDFVQTYRPINGVGHEFSREEIVRLQKTARVHIHPLDPIRPSEFFSMSVLESLAAGTPVIVSDADAMPELWGDVAVVIPRPIDLGTWYEEIERLLTDRARWRWLSDRARRKAEAYTWEKQARRLLALTS